MPENLKVLPALSNEVFKDMVRVPEDFRPSQNGHVCRISVRDASVLASVRGSNKDAPIIMIDEFIRDKLCVEKGSAYEFNIQRASIFGRIWWHVTASDPAVRIPALLGAISLMLGLFSLVLGGLSLWLGFNPPISK